MPKVSVLMSVYNAKRYVGEAVASILSQTFADFEFIVIDDGSTDGTGEILRGFHDKRILLVKNEENIGLTKSLNKGLQLTRGEYIARLDADDVSMPERLEKQVRFLDAHPDVGLVATAVAYVGPDGEELGVQRIRRKDFYQALVDMDFIWEHSAALFRAACMKTVGLYREEFEYAQDYDLWLRIAEEFDLMVLNEPLVKLRLRPESISATKRVHQKAYVLLAVRLAKQRRLMGKEDPGALPKDGDSINLDALATRVPTAIGRACLRMACLNYLLDDVPEAKRALADAVRWDPALLEDPEAVLRFVVYYGFDRAATLTSRVGAVRFVNRVFTNLPAAAKSLARFESKALGQLYMLSAFESYEAGNLSLVRREVPLAVVHDPCWLRNRGVWSVLMRSLVGIRRTKWRQARAGSSQSE